LRLDPTGATGCFRFLGFVTKPTRGTVPQRDAHGSAARSCKFELSRRNVPGVSDAERLADAVVQFVRGFGLHRPERTPCGFDAGVAEAHALGELSAGTLRQGELAERLGLTKSTVSRLVTNLVDRGWAERWAVDDDGRGVAVGLTETGRDAATRLRKARTSRMQALLDAVPTDRRREVVDALGILEEASRAGDPHHA
jgi:DNA-binding MarR family transcriptional regulator